MGEGALSAAGGGPATASATGTGLGQRGPRRRGLGRRARSLEWQEKHLNPAAVAYRKLTENQKFNRAVDAVVLVLWKAGAGMATAKDLTFGSPSIRGSLSDALRWLEDQRVIIGEWDGQRAWYGHGGDSPLARWLWNRAQGAPLNRLDLDKVLAETFGKR